MIRTIIALGLGCLLLGGVVLAKADEETRLRQSIAAHVACDGALTGSDLSASASRCPSTTALVHRRAIQSEACDAALLGLDLFAVRTVCSTEVKTLFAAREAESRRADQLAEILAQERAGRAAAITRAETRARTHTERTLRAQSALQGAPRRSSSAPRDSGSAGGDLLVLDAERLRQLGGEGAAADRP